MCLDSDPPDLLQWTRGGGKGEREISNTRSTTMFQTKQTANGIEISYPGKETIRLVGWTIVDANQAIADTIEFVSEDPSNVADEVYEQLFWLAWTSQS
jgi:hypothetical protein